MFFLIINIKHFADGVCIDHSVDRIEQRRKTKRLFWSNKKKTRTSKVHKDNKTDLIKQEKKAKSLLSSSQEGVLKFYFSVACLWSTCFRLNFKMSHHINRIKAYNIPLLFLSPPHFVHYLKYLHFYYVSYSMFTLWFSNLK